MPIPEWFECVEALAPHVFRVSAPDGTGSGWLVSASQQTDLCVVATAAHVINHAHYWEAPIRVTHHASGQTLLLRAADRAINVDTECDTAAIIFNRGDLVLPAQNIPLMERDHHLKAGVEIAWLGYPAIPGADLCFFEGHISAYLEGVAGYLVDGVAINGVSGGPAFRRVLNSPELIGVVSAYIPNRATGAVLPGVALIRDVNRYHDLADRVRSIDEAKAQESKPAEPPPPPAEGETPVRA